MPSLTAFGALSTSALASLRPRPGGGANRLDHLNLLVAGSREDDVDGGRLLLGSAIARGACAGGRGGGGNGGRGDAELLLQRLDALRELEHRDALQLLDPVLGGHFVPCLASFLVLGSSSFLGTGLGSVGASRRRLLSGLLLAGFAVLRRLRSAGLLVSRLRLGRRTPPRPRRVFLGVAGRLARRPRPAPPLPTRPLSGDLPSATASPETIDARPRVNPVNGLAATPTSWPCRTSRPGSGRSLELVGVERRPRP